VKLLPSVPLKTENLDKSLMTLNQKNLNMIQLIVTMPPRLIILDHSATKEVQFSCIPSFEGIGIDLSGGVTDFFSFFQNLLPFSSSPASPSSSSGAGSPSNRSMDVKGLNSVHPGVLPIKDKEMILRVQRLWTELTPPIISVISESMFKIVFPVDKNSTTPNSTTPNSNPNPNTSLKIKDQNSDSNQKMKDPGGERERERESNDGETSGDSGDNNDNNDSDSDNEV
jgi:hypothetical protein